MSILVVPKHLYIFINYRIKKRIMLSCIWKYRIRCWHPFIIIIIATKHFKNIFIHYLKDNLIYYTYAVFLETSTTTQN